MNRQTITIEVDLEAARAYNSVSAEQRRKIDALLSLRLDEVVRGERSLQELMSEVSRRAQARGLTPDQLEQLLHDG